MGKIQFANPRARRKALLRLFGVTLLTGWVIFAIYYFQENIAAWLESHIDFILMHPVVVFGVSLVFVLPALAGFAYLYRIGTRTIQAKRFPPPGHTVSRDTLILEANQAIARGRLIQILSLLLTVIVTALPFYLWRLFYLLSLSYQGTF